MASDNANVPYVCTLSPEMVQKAEKELNEKPDWRLRDIQALRDMVLKNKALMIKTDDAFLLRFLRARKFDYDRAYALIVEHYKMKSETPEIFNNLKPSTVRMVLEEGVTGTLKGRDKQGCKVMILRLGKWTPERYGLNEIFKTNFLTLSKLIQDEETQINGITLINDMKDMGWNHAKNISPFFAKRISSLLQDCFPARFKGIHYINQPSFFNIVFSIVKPFMKEKLVSRLHFHGENFKELHQFIDPKYLPEEYGGSMPPFCNEEWTKTLLGCEEEFEANMKYGLVANVPESSKNKLDAMECLPGSFKKLNVD